MCGGFAEIFAGSCQLFLGKSNFVYRQARVVLVRIGTDGVSVLGAWLCVVGVRDTSGPSMGSRLGVPLDSHPHSIVDRVAEGIAYKHFRPTPDSSLQPKV